MLKRSREESGPSSRFWAVMSAVTVASYFGMAGLAVLHVTGALVAASRGEVADMLGRAALAVLYGFLGRETVPITLRWWAGLMRKVWGTGAGHE